MDIRQSPAYAEFMEKIGWKVEKVGKWQAFIRKFPLLGSFIKIQRIGEPVLWEEIKFLAKKHRAFKVIIEPDFGFPLSQLPVTNYQLLNSPYLPTRTIEIDLTKGEKEIFQSFSKKTRWAIKKALKNEVCVFASADIDAFLRLKTRKTFPFAFLIKKEIKALWQTFSPDKATLLLASRLNYLSGVLGGVLLLFSEKKAYYWLAAATPLGRRVAAASLLAWEAIKLAKKRGCRVFDFEGIYDPRFPQATESWQGFSHFKKGFGGRTIIYPCPIALSLGR